MKIILWIAVIAVLGLGAVMLIGAVSGPPSAQSSARDAIDLCWKDADDPRKPASTRAFLKGTCGKMVDNYETEYGRSATLRRD